MKYKGIIQKSEKNNSSRWINRYLAAAAFFVFVAFFGMINSVFARSGTVTVSAESRTANQKYIKVSRGSTSDQTLSSVMGSAQFSYSDQKGTEWRIFEPEISSSGRQIASVEVDTSKRIARLRITGRESGKTELNLVGEERVKGTNLWQKVFVRVTVEVLGQKPRPALSTDEIREKDEIGKKLDEEIKPQVDDLNNFSPGAKNLLLNQLEAMEKQLEDEIQKLGDEIKKEDADDLEATAEKRAKAAERLQKIRNLQKLREFEIRVEESIREESGKTGSSSPVFEALKRKYERELEPVLDNLLELSDAQREQLRREWGNMPAYLEQLINQESKSLYQPRQELLQEMKHLKEAIEYVLQQLKESKDDLELLKMSKKPLVMIHYGDSRRQDAEKAAEILEEKGFRVVFDRLGIQIRNLDGKILFAPNGNPEEAVKIANLVKTITAVTPQPGTPTVKGEPWVYFLVIYDPNGFR